MSGRKAKSTGQADKRSVTSAKNVRKAQATKAKRQSAESKAIAEYKKGKNKEVRMSLLVATGLADLLATETPNCIRSISKTE